MSDEVKKALERLKAWTPEATPVQFQAKFNPANVGKLAKNWAIRQPELDLDARAPFFSEAYLYNLLGKEDARTLLALIRRLEAAVERESEAEQADRVAS